MSLTPENEKVIPQNVTEVLRYIDMQVRRDVDQMRAKQYWERTLEGTPREVLVDALTIALASGRYQMTPRCQCCR
ncbi:hypothetical protein [Pseudomonas sp. P42]|uniref:hypothetical protein n=1 Tax=Pseudomonas sp. P42 TaxID=1080160 RepID=UPI001B3203FA|nr:hypothetical protein [Pseudomonas sp. P42]MBP5951305.1 hypothetical protein [Pseudomonas sp. P42]